MSCVTNKLVVESHLSLRSICLIPVRNVTYRHHAGEPPGIFGVARVLHEVSPGYRGQLPQPVRVRMKDPRLTNLFSLQTNSRPSPVDEAAFYFSVCIQKAGGSRYPRRPHGVLAKGEHADYLSARVSVRLHVTQDQCTEKCPEHPAVSEVS